MRRAALLFLIVAVAMPFVARAYVSPGKPAGLVNDFAGMLVPNEVEGLQAKLAAFEKSTSNEIAIVIIPSLGRDTIENFASKLFEEWKIGKDKKDNVILLLISKEDRKMRIEVGYGLEGALTDAQSYWIIQNILTPNFKAGNYYAGIDGAVDKIIGAIVGSEEVPSENLSSHSSSSRGGFGFDWFFLIFFIPVWLASILGRSKSWWAGGVLGGIVGIIIGFIKGFLYVGIISIVFLIPIGLLFDYLVSKSYSKFKSGGGIPPWWIGGGGFGGGSHGGFGGFGGGSSGGGGSNGSW